MAYLGTKPANQVIDSTLIADGTVTPSDLSTGKPVWDTSGNVGIGTNSPTGFGTPNLHINGTTPLIHFTTPTTGTESGDGTQIAVSGLDFQITNLEAGNLIFGTSTAERMRIDSSGGIWSSNQDQGFQLRSGGTKYGAMYFSSGYLRFQTYQSGNTWMRFEHTNGSATELRDGSTLNTNNSYGGLSDVRFKENIEPARDYLEDLCRVNIVKYSLKSENSPTPTKLGVIAQEVQEIFPNIVDADKPEELSVKYSVFVPMLIKAIQEQQAIITELKTRIEALEQA
jgi:hypothetical protein